jgi:hypothetical protein
MERVMQVMDSLITPAIVDSAIKRATRRLAWPTLVAGAIIVMGEPSAFAADAVHWIGTWATAAQPAQAARAQTFRNQTVRLIVHTSAGGKKVRIRLSNTYGDQPLMIGAAHLARRSTAADIDPASDRTLVAGC